MKANKFSNSDKWQWDFWCIVYVRIATGEQVLKPIDDDENGALRQMAIVDYYVPIN